MKPPSPDRFYGRLAAFDQHNENHRLATTTIAGDLFRGGGYDVVDCGLDLPADSFANLISTTPRLVAVGISTTTGNNRQAIRELTSAVRALKPDVTTMVGGRASERTTTGELGADITAPTVAAALNQLNNLTSPHIIRGDGLER